MVPSSAVHSPMLDDETARAPGKRPGVLVLQGSAGPHLERLAELGTDPVEVRRPGHLREVSHLVIPGGESTTLHHLLALFDLRQPILERRHRGDLAIFGTCAGAILAGREDGERPPRLGLLDAEVRRNAFGRQIDSFTTDRVELRGLEGGPFHAVFIRAPRFGRLGPSVRVLGTLDGEPVLVEAPGILAATFHPELTRDLRIHRRFLATPVRAGVA